MWSPKHIHWLFQASKSQKWSKTCQNDQFRSRTVLKTVVLKYPKKPKKPLKKPPKKKPQIFSENFTLKNSSACFPSHEGALKCIKMKRNGFHGFRRLGKRYRNIKFWIAVYHGYYGNDGNFLTEDNWMEKHQPHLELQNCSNRNPSAPLINCGAFTTSQLRCQSVIEFRFEFFYTNKVWGR